MVGVGQVGGVVSGSSLVVYWVLPSLLNSPCSSITLILSTIAAAFAFLNGLVSKQAAGRRPGSHAPSYELQELELWDTVRKVLERAVREQDSRKGRDVFGPQARHLSPGSVRIR